MWGNKPLSGAIDEGELKRRVQQRVASEQLERERTAVESERAAIARDEAQKQHDFQSGLRQAEAQAIEILANGRPQFEKLLAAAQALVGPVDALLTAWDAVDALDRQVAGVLEPYHRQLRTDTDRTASQNQVRAAAGVPRRRRLGLGPRSTRAEKVAAVVARLIVDGELRPSGVDMGNMQITIDVSGGA